MVKVQYSVNNLNNKYNSDLCNLVLYLLLYNSFIAFRTPELIEN